jgi:hypothetical protein
LAAIKLLEEQGHSKPIQVMVLGKGVEEHGAILPLDALKGTGAKLDYSLGPVRKKTMMTEVTMQQ